jgi:hypothetical protein
MSSGSGSPCSAIISRTISSAAIFCASVAMGR